MEGAVSCPECGAAWSEGNTCQDHFGQMLAWEQERPELGQIHHLMVLCYHLQHPSLYSPQGLDYAKSLLTEFLIRGVTPMQVRRRNGGMLDSGKRKFKIKGTPASHGAYTPSVQWTMTAAEVVAGGMDRYIENVQAWAQSVYAALKSAGSLPSDKL